MSRSSSPEPKDSVIDLTNDMLPHDTVENLAVRALRERNRIKLKSREYVRKAQAYDSLLPSYNMLRKAYDESVASLAQVNAQVAELQDALLHDSDLVAFVSRERDQWRQDCLLAQEEIKLFRMGPSSPGSDAIRGWSPMGEVPVAKQEPPAAAEDEEVEMKIETPRPTRRRGSRQRRQRRRLSLSTL